MPIAIVAGLLIAIGRLYGPRWLAMPLAGYVEVIRGTPLMLQLFVLFYVLPELGVMLCPWAAGIAGLAINYSAYESEIYRAGLQAIPKGQMEAALALGMSRKLALRRVIVPQAVRIVIPPVTSDFIALFKDTSICSVLTLTELTKRYSILSNTVGGVVEFGIATAVLYLAMSLPLSWFSRWMERRLDAEGVSSMIEVNGLIKRFGGAEILRGVSLSVARGEVAAIIGAVGIGQEYLAPMPERARDVPGGHGRRGRPSARCVAAPRASASRRPARSAGGRGWSSRRTTSSRTGPCWRTSRRGRSTSSGWIAPRPARAERLLDRVGLRDKLAARPRSLSGGQQQRVAIARALAMEPLAMLFDEPTSALDPRMTAEVLAVMADLARDGLTMVVVTHAMRFARRLATTVHVIADGLIAESGPPDQVFDAPRTEATRRLLAEVEAA